MPPRYFHPLLGTARLKKRSPSRNISFLSTIMFRKGLTFTSPSVKTFQAYSQPLVLKKGEGQYLWDVNGKKYLDLMAQNLCISVGYNHPLVNREVKKQMDMLTHSTAMYVQPIPVHYAEELAARFPGGQEELRGCPEQLVSGVPVVVGTPAVVGLVRRDDPGVGAGGEPGALRGAQTSR